MYRFTNRQKIYRQSFEIFKGAILSRKFQKNILVPTNKKMIKKRLQDNIENVLNAIDNVVGYHHVAKRQKDLINKGVQGDLNTYIKSLSEVQSAVEFFAQVGFQKLKILSLADNINQ